MNHLKFNISIIIINSSILYYNKTADFSLLIQKSDKFKLFNQNILGFQS